MYRVFLNGTLYPENEVIDINQSFEVGIVREDGYANTEQIIREKSEAKLGFTGSAYRYICSQRRTNLCSNILCTITYDCGTGSPEIIFEGYISQDAIEIRPRQCIANIKAIKDNSFSGLFRDYIDTEVPLYANKSKGCVTVTNPERTIEMYDDPANLTSTVNITAFDVFDVLNYIVQYFTDTLVYVRSDYLTGVTNAGKRYAITTGYNMHNTSLSVQEKYPRLSFSQVFGEIRKKTRVYMVVEYDTDNNPYLRIEPESYSYDATSTALEIDDLPITTVETIDYSRFFNSVKVGSQTTDLQDGSTEYYSNAELVSWIQEVFNSCSECSADKDSEGVVLDLVSGFIIDSNITYEALQQVDGSDYANDESIFMFEYEVDATDNSSNAIITAVSGDNIYNDGFRNENVINNWLGYTPGCISLTNTTTNYFLAKATDGFIVSGSDPDAEVVWDLRFDQEIFDNAGNYTATYPQKFTSPTTGSYRFKTSITIEITDLGCLDSTETSNYTLEFWVYDSGNTLLTTYAGATETHFNYEAGIQLEYISPPIEMTATDYVIPILRILKAQDCGLNDAEFLYSGSFELYDEPNGCNIAESNEEPTPYMLEFDYALCHEDYLRIKENKRAKFVVSGTEYYLKELKYVPRKVSKFKLIGKESICDTCATS